jgi:hypothetical protein
MTDKSDFIKAGMSYNELVEKLFETTRLRMAELNATLGVDK